MELGKGGDMSLVTSYWTYELTQLSEKMHNSLSSAEISKTYSAFQRTY